MPPQSIVVVGGGLAGTWTSLRLCEAGCAVTMLDALRPDAASRVAAGLFNTVTGKRAGKTWRAEELRDGLLDFFKEERFAFLRPFLRRQLLYRPFNEVFELNEWAARAGDDYYGDMVVVESRPWRPDTIINPLGGLQVRKVGWLSVGPFVAALQSWLAETYNFRLRSGALDYRKVVPERNELAFAGETLRYDALVFCEGIAANANPFWPFRPLGPLKGQILVLRIPGLSLDRIVVAHQGYILPLGEERFLLGATYERKFADARPDDAGRERLLDLLPRIFRAPPAYEIREHFAGARPTTADRRPAAGAHPEYPNIWFLNGLGSKGVLQAPFCSARLAEALLDGAELPPEIDARRKSMRPKHKPPGT